MIYKTKGVCATHIEYDIDKDGRVRNVKFHGGCNGNLKAMAKLVEGMTVAEVKEKLSGIGCGMRPTSCADQLVQAVTSEQKN
ncbi:MAG: TIGR03905 family TSCPD domain-containing protein [Firmicutes bacterium]|nr:TIGR03905 family TSCPD domain-containing protein [Bacillota bacterium]